VVANGTLISLRQVGADDHAALAALFARLTPESRYQRFLSPKCELTPRELTFVTDIDHLNHEAIAAVDQRDNSIVGVARYVRDADRTEVAEMAIEVADAFQRMGIGTALASLTNDRALANGLTFLTATTLWENPAARRLLRRHGFRSRQRRRGTSTTSSSSKTSADRPTSPVKEVRPESWGVFRSHTDASRRVRCSLRGGAAPWFELFRNAVKAGVLRGPEELRNRCSSTPTAAALSWTGFPLQPQNGGPTTRSRQRDRAGRRTRRRPLRSRGGAARFGGSSR
jgi:RimJ/RimL family protein N-acetyltransferase